MNRNGSLSDFLVSLPWFHLASYLCASLALCLSFMLTMDSMFARVPGLFLVTGSMAAIGWGFLRLPARFRKLREGYGGNVVDALPGTALSLFAFSIMFRDFGTYLFGVSRSGEVSLSLIFLTALAYIGLSSSAAGMKQVPEPEFRYGVETGDLLDLGIGYLVFVTGAGISLALSPFGETYQAVSIGVVAIPVFVAVALLHILPRTLDEEALRKVFRDGEILAEYGTAKGLLLFAPAAFFLSYLAAAAWRPDRPTMPFQAFAMMAFAVGAICSILGISILFRDGVNATESSE